ncbi:DUF2627 domain-containing protein [Caldalkalibacillus salinus]|uniref:DUF2627 domain-containing protein n=1 Tax=Caldalkalibacillus salinus TaxID=2803787 RepID=UPI0019248112|nr:DUF2627 domain-containing protein [Caldalkalibacillus salinus]
MTHNRKRSPQRFVALLILVIPGSLGMYGWTLMRDATFTYFDPETPFLWLSFIGGSCLFLLGVTFVGGYIFYRDRKKKLVQPKFQNDIDD